MNETLTLEEQIAQAICLAPHLSTRAWAVRWLSGEDRTAKAAEAAWSAATALSSVSWVAVRASASAAWVASVPRGAERAAAVVNTAPERFRQPALDRARAILAGTFPAERYDEPLS